MSYYMLLTLITDLHYYGNFQCNSLLHYRIAYKRGTNSLSTIGDCLQSSRPLKKAVTDSPALVLTPFTEKVTIVTASTVSSTTSSTIRKSTTSGRSATYGNILSSTTSGDIDKSTTNGNINRSSTSRNSISRSTTNGSVLDESVTARSIPARSTTTSRTTSSTPSHTSNTIRGVIIKTNSQTNLNSFKVSNSTGSVSNLLKVDDYSFYNRN